MEPIPDPKLGPRRVDVANMYDTKRYLPKYEGKHGTAHLPDPAVEWRQKAGSRRYAVGNERRGKWAAGTGRNPLSRGRGVGLAPTGEGSHSPCDLIP